MEIGTSKGPSECLEYCNRLKNLYTIFHTRDGSVSYDARYILRYETVLATIASFLPVFTRPETIESLFIAYRLTGNSYYREFGWKIFNAIEKHCKIPEGGYASVLNVDALPVTYEDKMETFLMVKIFHFVVLSLSRLSLLTTSYNRVKL